MLALGVPTPASPTARGRTFGLRAELRDVGLAERRKLQELLGASWLPRRSCDRRGKMPSGLRLRQALRTARSPPRPKGAEAAEGPQLRPALRTRHFGPSSGAARADYLFHGTSWANALRILREGFRPSLFGAATRARARAGGPREPMFPGGLYFAECSSKADEYTSAPCAMLLCRCALGRVLRTTRKLPPRPLEEALAEAECDSLVCDLEEQCHSYREFVVTDPGRAFPEYLLLYDRVFQKRRGLRVV
ncbi:unnamed protein product [Effrenium voratum]|uniref:PARP catalytic domain-containing protein n=1 Tax=Effrenium voratum TaxID=2562239 RepID=A0AA36JJ70_9DINO|nr:unnamed protein product [Effrenium voratum]CAJ1436167.1 unnamed protein product [Effrenium voratum]